MTDAVEHARGVSSRATAGQATLRRQGNPGIFLGVESLNGVQYARYRAQEGTWVSSSMQQLGYDRRYGSDVAFGAYIGLVRSPNGTPLSTPDRIRPGQEYLVPLPVNEQAGRIAPEQNASLPQRSAPSARSAVAGSPGPRPDAAQPNSGARQRGVGERGTTSNPIRRVVHDDPDSAWAQGLLARVLRSLIGRGTLAAASGHWVQEDQLEHQRGSIGVVSDWLHDVEPPYIGAWTNASNLLVRASERLAAGDVKGAMFGVVGGYTELLSTQQAWHEYVDASIAGAGKTIKTLENVRDASAAVEAGLITGNLAAPVGFIGGVVVGTATTVGVASESNTELGEGVRGTLDEVQRSGWIANLRLARQGLVGIAVGIGQSLSEIPNALRALPKTTAKLLRRAGDILVTLFTDPKKLAEDLARLPEAISLIFEALNNRWEWLKALPPEKQAFEIGRLTGHIEAALMVLEVGPRAGAAAGDVASDVFSTVKGGNEAAIQLVRLRTQLQAVGAAAGTFTAVAMAAAGPPSAGVGTTGKKAPSSKKKPEVRQFEVGDVADYREFGHKQRIGDNLEGHEVLQNLWLEVKGVIKRRGKGIASRWNPSVALPPGLHDVVDDFQRALRLFERAKIRKLTYKQVLSLNALALKHAGLSQAVIDSVLEEALEHAIFSLARAGRLPKP